MREETQPHEEFKDLAAAASAFIGEQFRGGTDAGELTLMFLRQAALKVADVSDYQEKGALLAEPLGASR